MDISNILMHAFPGSWSRVRAQYTGDGSDLQAWLDANVEWTGAPVAAADIIAAEAGVNATVATAKLNNAKAKRKAEIDAWFAEYEQQPVSVNGIQWDGGYESAMRKDASRRFSVELGRPSFTFFDAGSNEHILTKPQADAVVQALAAAYETKFAEKAALVAQVNAATSEAELPAVPSV